MPFRRISVLADINVKIKDNSLWLHPAWHFVSKGVVFSYIGNKNFEVDKIDYLFREWLVTGATAVTI